MVDRTSGTAPAATRARWPYVGPPQVLLLIAGLVTMGASFLPWLPTAIGDLGGSGGVITFYAGVIAVPGAIWRSARVVLVHALILAGPALILPAYRLAWAALRLPAFGTAWFIGPGLLLVFISGGIALYAASRLWTRSTSPGG